VAATALNWIYEGEAQPGGGHSGPQANMISIGAVDAESTISRSGLKGERQPDELRTSGWRQAATALPLGSYNVLRLLHERKAPASNRARRIDP
jgi:hypothetical protein